MRDREESHPGRLPTQGCGPAHGRVPKETHIRWRCTASSLLTHITAPLTFAVRHGAFITRCLSIGPLTVSVELARSRRAMRDGYC